MTKCGDCILYPKCKEYVDENESFPEVGGCEAFIPADYEYQITHRFAKELKSRCIKGGIYPAFIDATINRLLHEVKNKL
jgi:hypothetical protein